MRVFTASLLAYVVSASIYNKHMAPKDICGNQTLNVCFNKLAHSEKILANKAAKACFVKTTDIDKSCGKYKTSNKINTCKDRWYKASLECAHAANMLIP